jgi:hypothetical protein
VSPVANWQILEGFPVNDIFDELRLRVRVGRQSVKKYQELAGFHCPADELSGTLPLLFLRIVVDRLLPDTL